MTTNILEVRVASQEEIDWIKVQLQPAAYYLDKFLALGTQYGAIEVDSTNKAGNLKGKILREITKRNVNEAVIDIELYKRDKTVFLVNKKVQNVTLDIPLKGDK